MLMKAVLVSSLAYRPRLLVLDEPFTGLDPLVRDEFVTGLLEAADLGNWTMLISSHDIDDVERLTDRVVMLEAGRLRLAEDADRLAARFRRVELQLEASAPAAPVPAAWLDYDAKGRRVCFVASDYDGGRTEALCAERFPGATFTAAPMSLKEIFISLARQGRKEAKGAAA
jgi:ABC-2 type transport system ATP-binding protein